MMGQNTMVALRHALLVLAAALIVASTMAASAVRRPPRETVKAVY